MGDILNELRSFSAKHHQAMKQLVGVFGVIEQNVKEVSKTVADVVQEQKEKAEKEKQEQHDKNPTKEPF